MHLDYKHVHLYVAGSENKVIPSASDNILTLANENRELQIWLFLKKR